MDKKATVAQIKLIKRLLKTASPASKCKTRFLLAKGYNELTVRGASMAIRTIKKYNKDTITSEPVRSRIAPF